MRLLRRGDFALLVAGSSLNAIGSWATIIAVWGYAAYRFHASSGQIAVLGLAWSFPAALLSPIAGVPIDRIGPRRVLILSDLVGVVASLSMAAAGRFSTLVALAFVSGAVQAFGRPAAMSLPARIVGDDDLLAANAFLGAAEQSAIVFGPLVAAVAISAWGIRAPFLFDAATFVAGAVAVAPVHLRPVATVRVDAGPVALDAAGSVRLDAGPVAKRSAWVELREGLVLARSIRDVRRALALAGAVFFTWGAFFVLEPLYVRDVLHRSAALLGLFQTVFGVGLVATTLLLPALGDRVASLRVLAVSVALSGVAAATYVGTHSVLVAFVGVFLWGVDVAFFLPPMQTVMQRATPVEAHGRVLGLASTLEAWGSLIAIPLTGLVVASIGVSRTGMAVGAVAVAAGLAGLVRIRRTPVPVSQPSAV